MELVPSKMSDPTGKIKVTKEKEIEMEFEKTHTELVNELEALVMAENPNKQHLLHSMMYGTLLAHITKEQLQYIIDLRKMS